MCLYGCRRFVIGHLSIILKSHPPENSYSAGISVMISLTGVSNWYFLHFRVPQDIFQIRLRRAAQYSGAAEIVDQHVQRFQAGQQKFPRKHLRLIKMTTLSAILCSFRHFDVRFAYSDSQNCSLVVITMGASQFSDASFSFPPFRLHHRNSHCCDSPARPPRRGRNGNVGRLFND